MPCDTDDTQVTGSLMSLHRHYGIITPTSRPHYPGTITPAPLHRRHHISTLTLAPSHKCHHIGAITLAPSHRHYYTGAIIPAPSHRRHHTSTITPALLHTSAITPADRPHHTDHPATLPRRISDNFAWALRRRYITPACRRQCILAIIRRRLSALRSFESEVGANIGRALTFRG